MSRPLSVLHVSQPVDGGVARYVADAVADQQARGWSVTVVCPDGPLAGELEDRGTRPLYWPALRSPRPTSTAEALKLATMAGAIRPDVVHLHSSKAGLAGRLGLRGRLPTVFQPHGWSWLAVDGSAATAALRWEQLAARWTDVVVCVGDDEAAEGRARGVTAAPYEVVRNGVDLTRFRPVDPGARAAARRLCGLPAGVPVAVCVGRLTRQKGQDVLLRAWPAVRDRHPEAVLALVGPAGDGAVAEHPGVLLAGPAEDVRPWYAAADVAVLPSRWEGLPLVLLEALAAGLPVVASAVPGIAGVLSPDAGELTEPEDAAALARAIRRRLDDPALRAAESAAAVRHAAAFDLAGTLDRLATVTRRAAERPHIPSPRRPARAGARAR